MTIVVAAALVDGDPPRVLAAQRAFPPELAGLWELPGGKVRRGEADIDALRRECREELDVEVAVGARVCADTPTVDGGATLRVWWARPVAGTPRAVEHTALRWLGPDDLDTVAWLPSDLPVVAAIRAGWPGSDPAPGPA